MVDDRWVPDLPSRQLLLYDAATRWNAPPLWRGPDEVIEAAVNCLVDGIDSPSLRLLAGASPKDPADEIKALVEATLRELGLPEPGAMPRTKVIGRDGAVLSRLPRDTVRFEIASTEPELAGHEVLVYVNEVEMTRLGAGMGMDPFDLLIPENRLVATATPRRVGIARCECGEYGCGSTDVVIVRDENAVHWDWESEAPIRGGVSFKADEYDAEVARIGADSSWERPEDTTARLTIGGADRERLASIGLRLDWVAKDHADHDFLKVALYLGNSDWDSEEPGYQVFLRVPRKGRTPQVVAAEALAILAGDPRNWSATWHATKRGTAVPPSLAGRKWRQESIGLAVPERVAKGRRFLRRRK
jgi:hypothetical protein